MQKLNNNEIKAVTGGKDEGADHIKPFTPEQDKFARNFVIMGAIFFILGCIS